MGLLNVDEHCGKHLGFVKAIAAHGTAPPSKLPKAWSLLSFPDMEAAHKILCASALSAGFWDRMSKNFSGLSTPEASRAVSASISLLRPHSAALS
jgi:hypothetical protein